jgi:hypothetical protein
MESLLELLFEFFIGFLFKKVIYNLGIIGLKILTFSKLSIIDLKAKHQDSNLPYIIGFFIFAVILIIIIIVIT